MANVNENSNANDNDGSPSNDQQLTPPSKQCISEQPLSANEPNAKDLRQHFASQSFPVPDISQNKEKQCHVCHKKFGVRRMRRKHTCRRCNYKVCGNCSSKKRYDSKTDTMVRVCDTCVQAEHCIVMTHRLRNLKLKHNKRNRGTYIVKVNQNSKEYGEGLINKCKIIEINEQNVEALNAQLIADKLNTIKIPFSITLDYTDAEIKHNQLKNLKNKRKLLRTIEKNKGNDKHKKKQEITAQKDDLNDDVENDGNNGHNSRGTTHLMNAHQNPHNAYYYQPPVIVTGPSNDMRNMYKVQALPSPYQSDSYNDAYYDHREEMDHQCVIYEESPKKNDDNESEGEMSSSDGDTEDRSEEESEEQTPELMQYDDESEDESEMHEVESDHGTGTIVVKANVDAKDEGEANGNVDVDPPQCIRAKSVPVTPIINGVQVNTAMVTTSTPIAPPIGIAVSTPFVEIQQITLESMSVDNDTTSKTPKGDKSAHNVLNQCDAHPRKRARSLSEDNLDPSSLPLQPRDIGADGVGDGDGKKKKGIFGRKKIKEKKSKKKKKKKKLDQDEHGDVQLRSKKKKFFRRKKHDKVLENYNNLHHGLGLNLSEIQHENSKAVIHSNIGEYSTQNLHPPAPNYHKRASKTANLHGKPLRNAQYTHNAARQRLEMQQHIVQSNHVLVNPYRQFSIAFNNRPFNIKLQFRNGFNAFIPPSSVHIQQSHTLTRPEYIWGWYSVEKHSQIPIGSKLMSINFEWICGKNQAEIAELMYNSALPTTLIFEAPSYMNHVPPSTHLQLNDECDRDDGGGVGLDGDKKNDDAELCVMGYLESNKSVMYWWLEEGGFVLICLAVLALIVLDVPWYSQLYCWLPLIAAVATVFVMTIPPRELFNLSWSIMHLLIFKVHQKRRGSGLTLFGRKLLHGNQHKAGSHHPNVRIANDQSLLNPYLHTPHFTESVQPISSRRSMHHLPQYHADDLEPKDSPKYAAKKKKRLYKTHRKRPKNAGKDGADEKKFAMDQDNELQIHVSSPSDHEEKIDILEEEELFEPNWETDICFPGGGTEIWGTYKPCTAKTLKLRGAEYLTDKIKIPSQEALLSLANIDIFTVHNRITHMAQNEVSWFHQNRKKLPRSLFFIIFHLRLDSMTASVVQYFYIDKNKFKHLLQQQAVAQQAKEKGDGYFAIGGKGFDESGMFWNFINGPCRYRDDRLKLLARKEEGPWYLHIPSRPAIIGRQVPIEYMRGYNADFLNSVKTHSTRSDAYEPYEFKTLYHDAEKKEAGDTSVDIPCDCGKCVWVNTRGEYPEYIEVDITCEVNAVARNTIRLACPLAKGLQVEMHWTMEGQINEIELPEQMLASARLIHVDLSKLLELD